MSNENEFAQILTSLSVLNILGLLNPVCGDVSFNHNHSKQ